MKQVKVGMKVTMIMNRELKSVSVLVLSYKMYLYLVHTNVAKVGITIN